jgi:Mlc titration factor MtfA (ptsG expression regulator)
MFAWSRRWRRVAIRLRPFSVDWRAVIDKYVPYVACLTSEDREELAWHIQVFLAEKHFEGCGGLVMTDEPVSRLQRRLATSTLCRCVPSGNLAYCNGTIDAPV